MRLVITGGLGHIGSYLIRNLSDHLAIDEIIVIDSLQTQRYWSLYDLPKSPKIRFVERDVRELERADIVDFGAINCLIHLAATTDAAGTFDKPEALFANNLGSTSAISSFCSELNIPMIFPSSTSVYGSQDALVDERCSELRPQSPYAECKLEEEDLIQARSKEGLRATILRLGTIHGVSRGMRFHTAVNRFCYQAATQQPLTVWRTALEQKRPYLSLIDAGRSIGHVIKNELFSGEIYNVVTANYSVGQIIDEINLAQRHRAIIELVDTKIMNQLSYEVSTHKIESTGFVFEGKLSKDIQDTLRLLSGISNE